MSAPRLDDPMDLGIPPGRAVRLPGRGTTWARDEAGPRDAPVLMLLHGLGATGALNWAACFRPLGHEFRAIAIDHRGHGRGVRVGFRPFRLEDCADDAVALADTLGIDRFIPVGYSMGGPIAQLLWRRHPDRVEGLVLCATARNFGRRPDLTSLAWQTGMTTAAAAVRLVPRPVRRGVVRAGFSRRFVEDDRRAWAIEEVSNHEPAALIEATRALTRYSSHDWIGDVAVPTSVVVTLRDSVVAPVRQYRMASSIPGAEVFPVDGDHTVCATAPRRFVPALLAACRSVTGRAAESDPPRTATGS